MRIITLTTDFGSSDWFVGTMKGVILGINPQANVVDITHEIPPGDVRAGAFALMASCRYFPKDAIHLAVVDPGVGSQRRAIAVQTLNGVFIGPDNGVLSWALMSAKIRTIRLLENQKYFLKSVSRTFHGRDIFAPVAAHVSRNVAMQKLGRQVKQFQRLTWPRPKKYGAEVRGEIVYLDRFGNGITNIDAELLDSTGAKMCKLIGRRNVGFPVLKFYNAVRTGLPLAVIGSCGFLEIALNGGSAARQFGLKISDKVILPANHM